ncbi:phosphatase PAP2 family protein [Micromonospora sp. 4G57]|uniref:Phosphatase PAP2 family protein n=1 Tax=Micromonospora sicca TaxID=2202420 RepID=A0ABU5JL08_9ACTN|nr:MULTISPECIES: phosphatase PAP2 family protein [unclassified Micromonospora]MDZ5447340.1 phosphatase PAP2 family protein [Micromonospora sp. 4G57]MDZ5493098.1 phosphatase PAP2 family protein [Micromonospora sp. 4G53]
MTAVKETMRRPLGHFAERSVAGLLAVVGAGAGFGVLLMLVRFKWGPLYHADHEAAEWFNGLVAPHHALVTVLQAVTDLGGRPVLIWLVTIAVVGLLIRRQSRLAVYLIITGVGGLILDPSLKALVGRLRPVVDVPITHAPGNSFPSGHALGSFVAYGALLLVFLPAMSPRWRKPAVALGAVLVALIGLTRIALGVHFVSDVIAGWLLGALWLGVTAYAFRLWRRERGRPVPPLTEGLEPEAGEEISPAPAEEHVLEHPRSAVAELLVGWVIVFGALYAFGMFVSYHAKGTFFDTLDTAVPQWFAARRTDSLTGLSWWWSKFGDTHAILLVSLVFCPLVLAVWKRWRPVLFVVLAMFGELSLFLASARVVQRPRPAVENLDGHLPTSSFPSGHIAATICLWSAMAIIVFARTDRWWRWLFVALAVIMPVGVATSRMYRGMHHPTDFMGAILLAALWIGLLYWVVRPNADVHRGNQPAIKSEQVRELDDELAKAGRED